MAVVEISIIDALMKKFGILKEGDNGSRIF